MAVKFRQEREQSYLARCRGLFVIYTHICMQLNWMSIPMQWGGLRKDFNTASRMVTWFIVSFICRGFLALLLPLHVSCLESFSGSLCLILILAFGTEAFANYLKIHPIFSLGCIDFTFNFIHLMLRIHGSLLFYRSSPIKAYTVFLTIFFFLVLLLRSGIELCCIWYNDPIVHFLK